MRQQLRIHILLVLSHVHHPLQKVIRSHIAWIIFCGGFFAGGAPLNDHGDEEAFHEAKLAFHLANRGEKSGYYGSKEIREWTKEEDRYSNIDRVFASYREPLFVATK